MGDSRSAVFSNARGGTNRLSFVHFGDLHIRKASDENYEDFQNLIMEANLHLAGQVDFAFLPGDNADDGTEDQYQLVQAALKHLEVRVHAIAGDHDKATGTLNLFLRYLEPALYRAEDLRSFRLLFLNAMDGPSPRSFDFSSEQMAWVEQQLTETRSAGLRPLVFTHLYPSELETQGKRFSRVIREAGVELVEMGHTHYNELANDGHTIYATTRSTGQIEEGRPGFSITVIEDDVVSWKFKERGPWPFAMITSPSDEKLITRPMSPHQVVHGEISICARVWDREPVRSVVFVVGKGRERKLELVDGIWTGKWNSAELADGVHRLSIRAETIDGRRTSDTISILVNQSGEYREPVRHPVDYENAIGAYPEKCILGTQLGPNDNGTKGPWASWRKLP
jgi:hypothetical protein